MNKIKNIIRQVVIGRILGALSTLTSAQNKSDSGKSVKIIVGFPTGQATKSVPRLLAEKMHKVIGNNYIIQSLLPIDKISFEPMPGTSADMLLAAIKARVF